MKCDNNNPTFSLLFLHKGPFPLRTWNRACFVSFIDLGLKRAVKIVASAKKINETNKECFFPLQAWKRAFFVSFIDLRLKRAVKIEASAKKKSIKQTKNALFHSRSGNGP